MGKLREDKNKNKTCGDCGFPDPPVPSIWWVTWQNNHKSRNLEIENVKTFRKILKVRKKEYDVRYSDFHNLALKFLIAS